MSKRTRPPYWDMPGGWYNAGGDINWETYGGKWMKRDPNVSGVYWHLEFVNMDEHERRRPATTPLYYCWIKRLDLCDVSPREFISAIRSGFSLEEAIERGMIERVGGPGAWIAEVEGYEGQPTTFYRIHANPRAVAFMLANVAFDYGLGAPMDEFTGSKWPARIRASAAREVKRLIADEADVGRKLDKPVNAIGSTAREMGRGDIWSALIRGKTPEAKLARKMYVNAGHTLGGERVPLAVALADVRDA